MRLVSTAFSRDSLKELKLTLRYSSPGVRFKRCYLCRFRVERSKNKPNWKLWLCRKAVGHIEKWAKQQLFPLYFKTNFHWVIALLFLIYYFYISPSFIVRWVLVRLCSKRLNLGSQKKSCTIRNVSFSKRILQRISLSKISSLSLCPILKITVRPLSTYESSLKICKNLFKYSASGIVSLGSVCKTFGRIATFATRCAGERTNDENGPIIHSVGRLSRCIGRDFITTSRTSRGKIMHFSSGLSHDTGTGREGGRARPERANDKTQVGTHVRTRRFIYTKIVVFGTSVVRDVSVGFFDVRCSIHVTRLQIDGNVGPRSRRQVFALASANVCRGVTPSIPANGRIKTKRCANSEISSLNLISLISGGTETKHKENIGDGCNQKPNRGVAKANEPAKRRTDNTFTTWDR